MTDKPIPFSAPMVRALLDGRKTQTRRVIPDSKLEMALEGASPPYAPGDRLWVKEAWRACSQMDGLKPSYLSEHEPRRMEADGAMIEPACIMIAPGRYRHARFMPRWASRLTLTVTDVRVQRLQEISDDDIALEGVRADPPEVEATLITGRPVMSPMTWNGGQDWNRLAAFKRLWNSLHGPEAWDANPWCVAISFDVHRCNIDQMPRV